MRAQIKKDGDALSTTVLLVHYPSPQLAAGAWKLHARESRN